MSSTFPPPVAAAASVMAGLMVELVDVLDRVTAEAAAGTITAVRGPSLVGLAEQLWRSIDRATAVATHATGELHLSGDLRAEGFVTTKTWLRRELRMSERDAKTVVGRAASLRSDFVTTWQAWNAGEVSGAAVREITLGIDSVFRGQPASVRSQEVPVAESILLEVAKVGSVVDVRSMVERLRAAVNADGMSASELAAYEDQSFSCASVGSMVQLSGHLTKEAHALLVTALEEIVDDWYRTGSLPPHERPTGDDDADRRTRSRRRPHLYALALTELARRQLDNGLLGSQHGVLPHLHVVVDADRHTAGLPGELRVPGVDAATDLSAEAISRLLCDADVTVIATTASDGAGTALEAGSSVDVEQGFPGLLGVALAGNHGLTGADLLAWLRQSARTVLNVGRNRRTVPRRLRTAVEIRDGHCVFPGCTVDPSWCDAHHVLHWQHGGSTDLRNLVLLCAAHHRLVPRESGPSSLTPGSIPAAAATGSSSHHHDDPGPDQGAPPTTRDAHAVTAHPHARSPSRMRALSDRWRVASAA